LRERERERERQTDRQTDRKPISQVRVVARRGLHIANNFETKVGLIYQIERQREREREGCLRKSLTCDKYYARDSFAS
jgi:hypothetical protein